MTFECRFYSVLVGQELVPGAQMNLSRLQRIVPCFTQHAFSLVSVTLLRSFCLFVQRGFTAAPFLKIYIDFKCDKDAYWSGLYIIEQTNIIQ